MAIPMTTKKVVTKVAVRVSLLVSVLAVFTGPAREALAQEGCFAQCGETCSCMPAGNCGGGDCDSCYCGGPGCIVECENCSGLETCGNGMSGGCIAASECHCGQFCDAEPSPCGGGIVSCPVDGCGGAYCYPNCWVLCSEAFYGGGEHFKCGDEPGVCVEDNYFCDCDETWPYECILCADVCPESGEGFLCE